MKIILTTDIYKLGNAGDIVKVANGYARNYLLPRKMAIIATDRTMKQIDRIKKQAELDRLAEENRLKALAHRIGQVTLNFVRKADEKGHLYGSVSENDIVAALWEQDIEIHKSNVQMERHLKMIGPAKALIHLASGIECEASVVVADENGRTEPPKDEEPEEVIEEAEETENEVPEGTENEEEQEKE